MLYRCSGFSHRNYRRISPRSRSRLYNFQFHHEKMYHHESAMLQNINKLVFFNVVCVAISISELLFDCIEQEDQTSRIHELLLGK